MTVDQLIARSRDIHADNLAAGWWSDLQTGESILRSRNRPEMLMLVVSELSEAHQGWQTGEPDDKLPHLPMFNVELADTAIRLFDLIGAEEKVHGAGVWLTFTRLVNAARLDGDSLMHIVDMVSLAMEHFRKDRIPEYRFALVEVLAAVYATARSHCIDLEPIIQEKRAFNKTRLDHQIANRRAAGGKQF